MPRIVWDSATDGHWAPDSVAKDGETVRTPMMLFDSNKPRVNLTDTYALDGVDLDQFRPGFRTIGDAATRDLGRNARDAYVRDLQSAWKMDARKRKPDPEPDEPDEDENGDDDEQDARKKDARGFARPSQENPHQSSQAQGSHDRLGGQRHRIDDIRRPSIQARQEMIRSLQDAWKRPGGYQATPDPKERTTNAPRRNAGLSTRDGGQPMADVTPSELQARKDKAYSDYCTSLSNAWKSPAGQVRPQSALVGPGTESHIEAASDPTQRAEAIERAVERTRGA
jgi:hypothetical protein